MEPHWRGKGISRRSWLLAGLAAPLFSARGANGLSISFDGDSIRPVPPPSLHFLTQKTPALDRLKDGAVVAFVYQLQLFTIDRSLARKEFRGRFLVSYDLFEERFKVSFPGRSRTGMAAAQAEMWSVENMSVSADGLPRDIPFFLRLGLRAASARASTLMGESGLSVQGLAELLSRKPGADEPSWGPYESNPQRLSDLIPTPGRGARNG